MSKLSMPLQQMQPELHETWF